jgi:hypothetical protein
MKRFWLPVLLAGIVTFSTVSTTTAIDRCVNCPHKKMSEKKAVRKSKKGLKHGYYDVTHNKVTRATKINNGNVRYKDRTDIK